MKNWHPFKVKKIFYVGLLLVVTRPLTVKFVKEINNFKEIVALSLCSVTVFMLGRLR